jgi:lipopolysaccharide export system protein LptC
VNLHYTRYVNLMKVVLPVGILLTIGLTVGGPYFHSLSKEGLSPLNMSQPEIRENRMINPHYMATDQKGQPYQIGAEWAKQRTNTLADLDAPHGSMTMVEGQTFNVKAKSGVYDSEGKVLGLNGDVTLTSTDGYRIKTAKAHVTLNTKVIEGDDYIEGEGPTGSMRGQNGFKVETRAGGKVVTLKGPSRVVISGAAMKSRKANAR